MKKELVRVFVFVMWNFSYGLAYRVFYMKELGSCHTDSVEINISALSRNSSGILISGKSSIYEPGLNCSIYLRPPLSYGLVASIRSIDLMPLAENFEECENFIELSPVEHLGSAKICGYSNDQYEYQSYTSLGEMQIFFHTSNYTSQKTASFQMTFTAVRSENEGFCFKDEKRCRNHNCIWKGLTCDGHNNCGDLSDEIDKYISQCASLSPGESLAVILVTIIGSLILLFIAACLRGPKLTQQIERLSRTGRTNNNSDTAVAPNVDSSSRATIQTANRIRTNYGSTSQFLTSCNFSDMIYPDPPPRYEEISSASQTSVTATPSYSSRSPADSSTTSSSISQVPVISSRISTLPQLPGSLTRVSIPPTRVYVDSNPPGSQADLVLLVSFSNISIATSSYLSRYPADSSITSSPTSQVPVISSRISAFPQLPGSLTRVSIPPTRVYVDSNPPGSQTDLVLLVSSSTISIATSSYSSRSPADSSLTSSLISQVPVISSRISVLPQLPRSLTRVSIPFTRVYVDSNPPGSSTDLVLIKF